MKESAGLVIIKDNKILLGHPTNAPWSGRYSIPKGEIEPGETHIDAAIRETMEEVGIIITKDMIGPEEYKIEYRDKNNKLYKKLYYYIVRTNNFPDVIPKYQLQIEEIDWAGFLPFEEATEKIFWRFRLILDHIK